MEELTYTDQYGNEFMVNITGKTVHGIYTYADTAYADSIVNIDTWKSKTNGVFVHCPASDVQKTYKALKKYAVI